MAAIAEQTKTDPLQQVLNQISALGLNDKLVELESLGYTMLKNVLSPGQVERATAAIVSRVERTTSNKVSLESETGASIAGMQYVPYLVYDDPVFAEILIAPEPLALITYLLGESCLLSSMGCHFRCPGGMPLMLHSDNGNGTPAPFSSISYVANVNYALTPYSREAGALVMVPGSHKFQRQPTAQENFTIEGHSLQETMARLRAGGPFEGVRWADPPNIETMNIAPGDAVVWHGNTWHGSFRRDLPGVRLNLAAYFCRQFVQTQERHDDSSRRKVLALHANNPRVGTLLGSKQPYGWREEGPDYKRMARNPRGLYD